MYNAFIQRLLSQNLHDIEHMAFDDHLHNQILHAAEKLQYCRTLMCLGVGKSYHIAQKCASTLSSCGVQAASPSCESLLHGGLTTVKHAGGFICISKSGTTTELIEVLREKHIYVPVVWITACDKEYYREGHSYIHLPHEEEYDTENLLPTRTAVLSMIICDLLTACLVALQKKTYNDMFIAHPAGTVGERIMKTNFDQEIFYECVPAQ